VKPPILYRPATRRDLADCALIWYSAVDEYMARLNRPLPPPYLDPLLGLLDHLLITDPVRFMLAVRKAPAGAADGRPDRTIGFGIALQREHVWYLSQLYILPEEQRSGIGRALLAQIMPSLEQAPAADAPASVRHDGVMATCTDSAQPASNGLYSRYGIVPRIPVFNLAGTPREQALPPLPLGIAAVAIELQGPRASRMAWGRARPIAPEATPEVAESLGNPGGIDRAIDELDRRIVGYAHQVDHAYLRASGRTGFVYVTADGTPMAYGYSSEAGRFGPVAVLDETLTAPVVGHLMASIKPRGATSVWVPGANDRAMVALLRAGLRIEGFPAQLCWTRPFASFERYIPAGLALL
jgi:ribosomal protein S18 acetylase RimI-like enzyme